MARRAQRSNAPPLGAQRADATIGKTVHALLRWGFSIRRCGHRPGVAEVVGLLAQAAGRADKLSEERVEQLYEAWLADGLPASLARLRRRAHSHTRQAKPWRRRFVPRGHTLKTCAEKLLRNGGAWPADELSIKAWAEVIVLTTQRDWAEDGFKFPRSPGAWAPEDRSPTLGQSASAGTGWKTKIPGN